MPHLKTKHLLLFLFIIAGPLRSIANLYVHGYVKYANGTPVINYPVHISGDSAVASSACFQSRTRFTNVLGFYSDTLICSSAITKVTVQTGDYCTGRSIVRNYLPTATQNIESNFVICDSNNSCFPRFSFQPVGSTVSFNSQGSYGYIISDSVVTRNWNFGDGSTLTGNVVNPVHTYPSIRSYNVCLTIKTRSGCEHSVCLPVVIPDTVCHALYSEYGTWNSNAVNFNSTISTTAVGDSIISRKWTFGDSDSLNGNVVVLSHTYPAPGLYPACLTIKTAFGCTDTQCSPVLVSFASTNCNAAWLYQLQPTTAAGYPVQYNGTTATAPAGDTIAQHVWNFGDGTTSTAVSPLHVYQYPGTYLVCHNITTRLNCLSGICQYITITAPHCEAVFVADSMATLAGGTTALHYVRFNSTRSHGLPISDSIVSRKWKFGDGDSLTGNTVMPVHAYTQTGLRIVCLYITTASGCRDTLCTSIVVRGGDSSSCQSRFTTTAVGLQVTLYANTSTVATGDSIISRTWNMGNGAIITRNTQTLTYQYASPGVYNICVTIRTRSGCSSVSCRSVAVVPVTGNCVPFFTREQTATPRTIRFNSTAAYSQIPNDSIINRKWEFGDGQVLTGNVINPLHTYLHGGTYTACLTIYTAHCDKRWCQTVQVFPLDSTSTADSVAIVSLYPVPVTSPLYAVLYCSQPNINAQLSIYDVYGTLKWTQQTVLPFGNSTYTIPTSQLANGPYIFKIATRYGTKSRSFYKLN